MRGSWDDPEILDPNESLRTKPSSWRLIPGFLKTILFVSFPAAMAVWASWSLIHIGLTEGGLLPWLLLILMAPFTLALALMALVVDLVALVSLIAVLSGRSLVQVNLGRGGGFGAFRGFGGEGFRDVTRPPMRDVTPTKPEELT